MLPHDFTNYRQTELNNQIEDLKNLRDQYLTQLIVLKDAVNDFKNILHQKYDIGEEFIGLKNKLLK